MTPKQFSDSIERLGLTQTGAAKLFGSDPRTARRWVSGDRSVPECVAIVLRLLLAGQITTDDIESAKRER